MREQIAEFCSRHGIIVLAGAELTTLSEVHEQPQLSAAGDRLTTFFLLAERYPTARLVHSGRKESETARDLILGVGVDPERITFDAESRDTCESANNLRQALSPKPTEIWLLVTSAFHLPRAVACFHAVDWEIVPFPTDYRTGRSFFNLGLLNNLDTVDLAAHEWLGLVYYRVRGWTDEGFPRAGPRRDY